MTIKTITLKTTIALVPRAKTTIERVSVEFPFFRKKDSRYGTGVDYIATYIDEDQEGRTYGVTINTFRDDTDPYVDTGERVWDTGVVDRFRNMQIISREQFVAQLNLALRVIRKKAMGKIGPEPTGGGK